MDGAVGGGEERPTDPEFTGGFADDRRVVRLVGAVDGDGGADSPGATGEGKFASEEGAGVSSVGDPKGAIVGEDGIEGAIADIGGDGDWGRPGGVGWVGEGEIEVRGGRQVEGEESSGVASVVQLEEFFGGGVAEGVGGGGGGEEVVHGIGGNRLVILGG